MRNEKVISITNYLSKQDYSKKELLKEFDSIQLASKKDLENLSLGDSLSVNKAWIQYQRATFSFWKLFTACEKHPALFEQQDFLKMLTQAGESEVKLSVAITNFNEACNKLKRNDLVFKELTQEPPLPSDF